jgi:hypothetical protein
MNKKMKYVNYRNIMLVWGIVIVLCGIFYIQSIYTHFGKTFFALLGLINFVSFCFVLLFKNKIKALIALLVSDFEKVNTKSTGVSTETQSRHETLFGVILVSLVAVFGSYAIFLAITNVEAYRSLIREDRLVESGSAIWWFLAAAILLFGVVKRLARHRTVDFHLLFYVLLVLFFIVCGGEEISWGQRLFNLETFEIFKKFNIQGENNLHDIGSISIFANFFFVVTLIFFLIIPILTKRYAQLKSYLNYYSFPIPNRWVVFVFLICLFVWLVVGIRFGTLGFHPFSIYPAKYYTQMDDEIFEFMAAYSFWAFSLMDSIKSQSSVPTEA